MAKRKRYPLDGPNSSKIGGIVDASALVRAAEKMPPKHSPTPVKCPKFPKTWHVHTQANAAYVIRAIEAHEASVKAMLAALGSLEAEYNNCGGGSELHRATCSQCLLRAALALAKESR